MSEETTEPTVEELRTKAQRLEQQTIADMKAVDTATAAFKQVMKSGDVDKALEAADARTTAQKALGKSTGQLKTATNAIKSAAYAANAEQIATIHNDLRDGKINVPQAFSKLEALGVDLLTIDRSEESGKLIVNSSGPAVKRSRAGGGTGSRGQALVVDGETFTSASAAMKNFYPDSGPLNRESIISKLTNAGHEVN